MAHTLTLVDGRDLTYDDVGDPDGVPVVFTHGFRISRLHRHPDDVLTGSLGVRLIAPDQPGAGGSAPKPARLMLDWGADMEQLADALGLDTFAVAGQSAGTPHALAIAAYLPDRVTHGALVAPVGPFDDGRFARLVTKPDLQALMAMRNDPDRLRSVFAADVADARADIARFVESVAAGDPSDAAILLADPARRAMFESAYAGGATQDEEGRFETWMALWNWGFSLGDVAQPFDLFYGDADDVIPVAMPELLAELLPRATLHPWPGAGHNAFVDHERWVEVMTALVSGDPRRRSAE